MNEELIFFKFIIILVQVQLNQTGVQTVQPKEDIEVKNGDVIGFYFPGNSIIPFDGKECYGQVNIGHNNE